MAAKFCAAGVFVSAKELMMNRAIFYRPNGRKTMWLAFGCAIAIHIGAIAMSAGRAEHNSLSCVLTEPEIEGTEGPSETQPPPIDIPIPDPPNISDADETFHDESPPPHRQLRSMRVAKIRPSNGPANRTASLHGVKALAISAPRPAYPYEARRRQITGYGVAVLDIDPVNGDVIGAAMSQSAGSPILDDSTLSALRRWRFKPGAPVRVRVPITFTLTGASY
jgi:TonB family protein